MRKKAVPVGIEDFKELIQEGYYYIDKTLLIDYFYMLTKLFEQKQVF